MIDFGLSEEQEMIRDAARSFAQNELVDRARDADENFNLPEEVTEGAWAMGFVAGAIPESLGGAGMDRSPTTNVLVLEELGAGCPSLATAAMSPSLFVNPLLDFGTDEQKEKYLPAFTGESFTAGTLAMQEPDFTFDPANMKTTATLSGGDYTLNGVKRLVPLAAQADHILVLAKTSDGIGFDTLDAFIVPRDAEGLTIANEAERTIGFQAVPQYTVTLDGVKVGASHRLGGADGIDGARLINSIRVGAAALAVGCARAVTEFAIPYAKERHAFGKPIAQKQAIAFMIADMYSDVDAMRWMVWKAAALLEQNHPEATKAAVLAQSYVQRKAMKVADDGIQVFGGHGFIRELPVEMWFRHMRNLTIIEGPVAA